MALIDFVHKASLLIRIGYSIEIVPNIDISSQFKLNQSTNLELLFTHSALKRIKMIQKKPIWTDNLIHYELTVAEQTFLALNVRKKRRHE